MNKPQPISRWGIAAILASAATATAAPPLIAPTSSVLPSVSSASVSMQPLNIVYKADQMAPFLQAAATRRVDIAGIGDSNQLAAGDYGHDHGFAKAWGDKFGMYASEVYPANAKGGYVVLGVYTTAGSPYPSDQFDPALPAQYADLSMDPKVSGSPASAGYIPAGSSFSNGATIYITPNSPFFDPTHTMTWHSTFWQFPDASGDFTAQVRGDGGPNYGYSTLKTYPTVTIPAGPLASHVDYSLSIPPSIWTAGAEPWKLFLYDSDQMGTGHSGAVNGELYAVNQRMEDSDRTKGISYSTLLYQGGKSARDAAISLEAGTDASIAEWMRQMTMLQNVPKTQAMMLVQIEHGGNDRGQTLPSVGPNPAPSNTAAGFEDNLTAIVNRLRQVWSDAGYDTRNLFFNIGPYHQQATHIAELANLETGAMALADETYNVSVTRGSQMLSALTMTRDNYYISSTDDAHLDQAGYETIGRMAVNQLVSSLPQPNGNDRSDVARLSFTFTGDASAIGPSDLTLENLTTGTLINSGDISVTYDATTNEAEFTFPGLDGDVLPIGHYQANIDAPASGSGDNFVYSFDAQVPEPSALALTSTLLVPLLVRRKRRA